MGASRKLQAEIDRVLKKVQEGVELFDSIWNKLYDTDLVNLKDKYEAELKKEIKKLQRYRDQIKTWMQSSEIKDKKSLFDARKQIEREMERFKICEKESKTKAFSIEGLGQRKTDPKEKAKAETGDWINNLVGELESQVDNFEAEIEGLTVKKGKNRPPRLTHLETSITRHKAHIMKLELILRLLDNDQLSPEQVNDVKDFLEDYVERNQDDFDEFSDVDGLYESLPLDKLEALEDLVIISQPTLVKGAAVLKTPVDLSSSLTLDAVTPQQSASPLGQLEGLTAMDSLVSKSSFTNTVESRTEFVPVNVSSQLPGTPASIPVYARGMIESDRANMSSSSLNVTTLTTTENDSLNLPGRWASSTVTENGVARGIEMLNITGQSDYRNSNVLGADKELLSSGMLQSTPTYSLNNSVPRSTNSVDRTGSADSSYVGYPPVSAGGSLTSFMAPGMQQRQPGFQNLNEMGHFRGRTEIAPDQSEKFLQRFQQVQQQGSSNLLGIQTLGGNNNIQVQQQGSSNLLGIQTLGGNQNIQVTRQQQKSVQSSAMPFEVGIVPGRNVHTPSYFEQPCIPIPPQAAQYRYLSNCPKDPVPIGLSDSANYSAKEVSPAHRTGTGSFTGVDFESSRQMGFSSSQPSKVNVMGERVIHDFGGFDDNLGASTSSTGGWPNPQDLRYKYAMLESALDKRPQPMDSSRLGTIPQSYPQVQAPILNSPKLWNRMSNDNLFLAFYFQQHSSKQYMAAKALMNKGWRLHTELNTWFQQHTEPVEVTEEYVRGPFIYFDYQLGDNGEGWCMRMVEDFTFEYCYLANF